MQKYSLLGLGIFSLFNYYNRHIFGRKMKVFGMATGLIMGGIYGILNTSEMTTSLFLDLGPQYEICRILRKDLRIKSDLDDHN